MVLFAVAIFSGFSSFGQNLLHIPDTLSGAVINLKLQTGTTNFYRGLGTSTMGANGSLLGPTLLLKKGDYVNLNVENNLPDATTMHWHGMHVSPLNDGGPHTVIDSGSVWRPAFTVMNHAGTYWYHPHLHMKTNEHVSKGVAGFIIVRDNDEGALNLPRTYGLDDFPLVLQTKAFDAARQIVVGTALDTALMVNGTVDPYLDAPAQVIRLRLLNGSSERVYNLGFTGNRSFHQITTDGGLPGSPVQMSRLLLAPGERAEILVDLSALQGQNLDLISYGSEIPSGMYGAAQPGMGPGQTITGYANNPLNGNDFTILSLIVGAPTTNAVTTIPNTLVAQNSLLEIDSNITREITISPVAMGPTAIEGPFLFNNASFDMNVVNYIVPINNVEIWSITNNSPIAHPFHIHDVQFYILNKDGVALPANEQGRKDVVLVEAMSTVHMLTHEDDGMMGQFVVSDPEDNGTAEGVQTHSSNEENKSFSEPLNR